MHTLIGLCEEGAQDVVHEFTFVYLIRAHVHEAGANSGMSVAWAAWYRRQDMK